MPFVRASDGIKLYYEEAGSGLPMVFVHEFAGDHRSWEPQMRFFSRRYRCIAYDARGYPLSDVPTSRESYSQQHAVDDVFSIVKHLDLKTPCIVGLSMGGFATLHFGLQRPSLPRALVVAGCGYGAKPETRAQFQQGAEELAGRFETLGSAQVASVYAAGPGRRQLRDKDPRGWREFTARLAEHDPVGAALTMRGVQKERPSLWDLRPEMANIRTPVLIIAGDEDEPCLEPALLMKRTIPSAGLAVLPRSGHAVNLEEPAAFNHAVQNFLTSVETGHCGTHQEDSGSGLLEVH